MLWAKKKKTEVFEYTAQNQQADNYLESMFNAAKSIFSRSGGGMYGVSPNGKRNYNELFGYGDALEYADYKAMFERGGIAHTVVAKPAKTCWRDKAKVVVDEKEVLVDEMTALRKAKLFKALERADICNRIGKMSVMFMGIPDGMNPDMPVGSANKGNFDGLYFNVYEEDGIDIVQWDTDPASVRYNKPVLYALRATVNESSRLAPIAKSIVVHYSRIVHLAEGALSNSLEGCSALEAPWNALQDKDKVRGSSGEAFYRNARQKFALETQTGAQLSNDEKSIAALKENVQQFQDGQEDVMRLNKMSAKVMQPGIASPRDAFDINIEEVSGTTGIPVRILTNKEGGAVTGSEDKATWNALIIDRQQQECTPVLMDALSILDEAGIITLPGNIDIVWSIQSALSEVEAAKATKDKADAFKSVTEGLSTVGADEVLAKSVFEAVGLKGIEVNDIDFSEDDEETNKNIGG